jgi:hypothetical protein
VAADPELETRLLAVFLEELGELQRATAKAGKHARGGSVTFLQHFRSSLNLHPHAHVLALDGVYMPGPSDDAPPVFVRAPEPTPEQVRWLCARVAERARKLVARKPWPEAEEEHAAPVLRVFGAAPTEPPERRLHARVEGFDLHASAPYEADDRVAVERFIRYGMRGPIASGRLTQGPRDRLTYRLKTPKPDGTTELVLSPMALLERLSQLVPLPGRHMVRYHGCLASGAAWRRRIVPSPPPALPLVMRRFGARRIAWADLLRRVYLLEVLACACGGTRRVVSSIEEGPAAWKILKHLGLPHEPPKLAPARLDQGDFWPTGPPVDECCDPLLMVRLSNHDDVQQSPADELT